MRSLALTVVLALVASLGGVAGMTATAAPADAARTWGDDPLDDVLHWAGKKKKCGLTRNQLAALMLAPTFPETGAPSYAAPSPMTLSRWDNQSGLHSFGNPSSYRKAFWHPGIGPWQFDSAGLGAGQSAGERIDTFTAAEWAATTMADRWCANPSKAYVWAPWYGCGSGGSTCKAIYDSLLSGGNLVGLNRDGSVGPLGGMERRRCSGPGVSGIVLCHRVNPAKAQGHAAFAAPGFGPAPITAPFYVYVAGGSEYRFWPKAQTGYDVGIWARRPLGGNARSTLVWSTGQPLTDHGPYVDSPTGFVDLPAGFWAEAAILWASGTGLISGYPDQTFRPETALTRAQVVMMLWHHAGEPAASSAHAFTDSTAPRWYDDGVSWALEQGIVSGYKDGTFRPDAPVSRTELVMMLWNLSGAPAPAGAPPFTDVGPGAWHAAGVAWAAERGYVTGYPEDDTFRGHLDITRAQAVNVLWGVLFVGGEGQV